MGCFYNEELNWFIMGVCDIHLGVGRHVHDCTLAVMGFLIAKGS
jgi:hypothetical protein